MQVIHASDGFDVITERGVLHFAQEFEPTLDEIASVVVKINVPIVETQISDTDKLLTIEQQLYELEQQVLDIMGGL